MLRSRYEVPLKELLTAKTVKPASVGGYLNPPTPVATTLTPMSGAVLSTNGLPAQEYAIVTELNSNIINSAYAWPVVASLTPDSLSVSVDSATQRTQANTFNLAGIVFSSNLNLPTNCHTAHSDCACLYLPGCVWCPVVKFGTNVGACYANHTQVRQISGLSNATDVPLLPQSGCRWG